MMLKSSSPWHCRLRIVVWIRDASMTVLNLVVFCHWLVHRLDVKNDFLHDMLSESVYMHQPPGFRDPWRPDHVCLLQRMLYGFDVAYLLLYVDDILSTASSTSLLQRILTFLHQEFSMIDLGLGLTPVDTESKLGDDGTPVSDLTLYRSLLYSSSASSLVVYSDVDWAGCRTTRRYTSGYCVFLDNNLLSWSSKRQYTLSRSSAEAEYHGVANAVAKTSWLRNLLRELHYLIHSATIVYYDNVGVVYLSFNPVQYQRMKHIEIDIHFARDHVARNILHVLSRYQYVNFFIKRLMSELFDEFQTSLGVLCFPALTEGGCQWTCIVCISQIVLGQALIVV
ncbi:ribonuclease H-like domain-containing protein [Tanacetum coccineum]